MLSAADTNRQKRTSEHDIIHVHAQVGQNEREENTTVNFSEHAQDCKTTCTPRTQVANRQGSTFVCSSKQFVDT